MKLHRRNFLKKLLLVPPMLGLLAVLPDSLKLPKDDNIWHGYVKKITLSNNIVVHPVSSELDIEKLAEHIEQVVINELT